MSDILLLEKITNYKETHCYQYQKRIDTLAEDLEKLGWSEEFVKEIKLEDFVFAPIETKEGKEEATKFIERYEWLGTIGAYPTHWFEARYKDILGGVVIMGMPNAFSKLLGEESKNVERLISRGASASWTPFNLGSKFVMWAIKWMVKNTKYRLFTCYSDPQAKEQGSIYQALNFYYLGKNSGTSVRCINPYNKNSIITDRTFRARSFYKRYAKDLGIEWQREWNDDQKIYWERMPSEVEEKLRAYSKEMYRKAEKIKFPSKHKYAFVLGIDNRETKLLRKKFLENTKVYPYPKNRGE